MIDGATGLFGCRAHVWAEGAEWWAGYRRGIFPSLSSPLLSCGGGSSTGICHNTQVPTSDLRLDLTLLEFSSPLIFLQGWRSYLGMCKDERTYLLEQKCPNTTLDHKSAIVNLGETKLPSARIYVFCTNRQITPGKKWLFFFFHFVPPPLKVYEQQTQTLLSETSPTCYYLNANYKILGNSSLQQNPH